MRPLRNADCPCGSGTKYKKCCIRKPKKGLWDFMEAPAQRAIDYGETPEKWVICDNTGVKFFVDKSGRILVFEHKQLAHTVANLEVFKDQAPNDINVVGVGPTKWKKLEAELPHVFVPTLELAQALIQERIDDQLKQLEVAGADNGAV